MTKRYRFVSWFPEWDFGFCRLDPVETDLALIYEWSLFLGFWEIRRLATWMDAYSDEVGPMEKQKLEITIIIILTVICSLASAGYLAVRFLLTLAEKFQ